MDMAGGNKIDIDIADLKRRWNHVCQARHEP